MASGRGEARRDELQQTKEEITCSICGDVFTDPKTIPCLHTFCKRCIERSIESNKKIATVVCCPLCRAPLPQDNLESIPTDFTIKRLIEISNQRKEVQATVDTQSISTSRPENRHHDGNQRQCALKNHSSKSASHSEEKQIKNKKLTLMFNWIKKKTNVDISCDNGVVDEPDRLRHQNISQPSNPPDHPPLFVAKYDYMAREMSDLTIKKGELIYIVDDKEEGWWLVKTKSSGQEGYIPSNYIAKFQSLDAEV